MMVLGTLKMICLLFNAQLLSAGWGEVTFLAYSSFYDKTVITYWSSGTGFAGIAGAGACLCFLTNIIL